jgi:hypothetical protein
MPDANDLGLEEWQVVIAAPRGKIEADKFPFSNRIRVLPSGPMVGSQRKGPEHRLAESSIGGISRTLKRLIRARDEIAGAYREETPVKMSILIPVALALGLTAGLAPAPADAACWGRGCYNHHHWYGHRHWGGYYGQDYWQWRQFGGERRDW